MYSTHMYITYALLLIMYTAPCAAADTASQQQEQMHYLPISILDNAQITTETDIAAILSDYAAEQDPTKPHQLSVAQNAALNAALANYCGLRFPGLPELTKKTDLE